MGGGGAEAARGRPTARRERLAGSAQAHPRPPEARRHDKAGVEKFFELVRSVTNPFLFFAVGELLNDWTARSSRSERAGGGDVLTSGPGDEPREGARA